MSFAVMSFFKYISKRLSDQSFILCIQIINNMGMYWGVCTWHFSPPCRLQCIKIRSTFNCKVFPPCKNELIIFEVLLNYTHT